jgi:hypothetical protein
MGHALMENRHGLVISPRIIAATGTAEREAAEAMVEGVPGRHRITVGGDKAYDTRGFVQAMRGPKTVPHVAQNCQGRKSAIDGRTTRHPGYAVSQRLRKRVEEIFGWMKTVGNLRETRHRGEDRVGWAFTLTTAAYNLVRIRNLMAVVSPCSEEDARNTAILRVTGNRRSNRPRFISEFSRHKGAEIFLKEDIKIDHSVFSTA